MMSTSSVHIAIEDANDNSPIFHGHVNNTYILRIHENTTSSDPVSNVEI